MQRWRLGKKARFPSRRSGRSSIVNFFLVLLAALVCAMTSRFYNCNRPKDTLQNEMALTLLTTMEEHYVIPESSTNALLIRRFGQASPAVSDSFEDTRY